MRGRLKFDKDRKMKKDSLLVCIAFHYVPERVKYLNFILCALVEEYLPNEKVAPLHIIIDTNTKDIEWFYENHRQITVCVHENLEHPFHLTWKHRQHIKDNIDNYETFMYVEDDMYVPYENYLNYLQNFKMWWPQYVPSFIRVEEKNNEKFVADINEKQPLNIISNSGRQFTFLPFLQNYHAFWIMPAKELKETMKEDFVRLTDGREFAAMYVGWELGLQTLIEIEDNKVSKKCYSYHLPNNAPNVNLKVEDIFL